MGDDMDKVKEVDNGFNHGITLVERKNIVISGVKKIESFDSEEFLMETTLGYLLLKEMNLRLLSLIHIREMFLSKEKLIVWFI